MEEDLFGGGSIGSDGSGSSIYGGKGVTETSGGIECINGNSN
jgi:hypothetical protein